MKSFALTLIAALGCSGAFAGPVVLGTHNANTLVDTIVDDSISFSNAKLTVNSPSMAEKAAGTFTGGAGSVGFDNGIVLTTGTVNCVSGPNTDGECGLDRGGNRDSTTLSFNFSSSTGQVSFRYVFASEEFTGFVGAGYNDAFELMLNGVNIAQLPTSNTNSNNVSINNINCGSNSNYYRNNTPKSFPEGNNPASCTYLNLDIGYDGLTTVLTASGYVGINTDNTFSFSVFDRGDNNLDSGVFIEAGSFTAEPPAQVPEPTSLALIGLGLAGFAATRRRKQA